MDASGVLAVVDRHRVRAAIDDPQAVKLLIADDAARGTSGGQVT
jgi:hypothetical protein